MSQPTLKELLDSKRQEKTRIRSNAESSPMLRNFGRAILLLLLLLAPWCIGSVHTLPQLILIGGMSLALAVWWLDFAFFVKSGKGLIPYVFVPVFLGWVLALFQLIPLNHGLATIIAPQQAKVYERFTASPSSTTDLADSVSADNQDGTEANTSPKGVVAHISLDIDKTRHQTALLVLALGCVLTGSYFFKSRPGLLSLCWVMSINGAAISIYGIVAMFNKSDKILGIYEPQYLANSFSSFVNRNNASGFLLICLGCNLGLAYLLLQQRKSSGPAPIISREIPVWRRFSLVFSDFIAQMTIGKMVAMISAVIICCGIVATASRGGMLALLGGGMVTLLFFGLARRPKSSLGFFVVVLLITIVASTYLGFGNELNERINKISNVQIEEDRRIKNWQDTSQAIGDYGVWGSGLGSYYVIHRLYRQDLEERIFEYAENQYYQTLIEAGWVGVFLLVAALAITLWCVGQLLRLGISDTSVAAGLIGLFVIVSVGLASLFDFGLYLAANMCAMAVVIGMVCGNAHWHAQRLRQKTWLRFSSPHWMTATVGLILFASSIYFTLYLYRIHAQDSVMSRQPLLQDYETLVLSDTDAQISALEPKAISAPTGKAYLQLGQLYQHRYRLLLYDELTRDSEFIKADVDGTFAKRFWRETDIDRVHAWIYQARLSGNYVAESNRKNSTLIAENLRLARAYYLRARDRQPLRAETHMLLAQLEPISDRPEDDEIHIERSVELSPSNANLRYSAGKLHGQAGRIDLACQHWRRSLELSGKEFFLHILTLARLMSISNETIYEKILPDNSKLLYEFAALHLKATKQAELRHVVLVKTNELLANRKSTDFDELVRSAEVKLLLNLPDEALAEFGRAVKLRPYNQKIRYRYATKLLLFKKTDEARIQAKKLVNMNQNSKAYKELLKRTEK